MSDSGSLVGGIALAVGLTLGVSGYVLVVALLVESTLAVLPGDPFAVVGSFFVVLGVLLIWLGGTILPAWTWDPAGTSGTSGAAGADRER